MSDETSTSVRNWRVFNKGQAVDLLLNVNAPEEASEDTQEPVAEAEVAKKLLEQEAETEEAEYESEDDQELPEDEEKADEDEEYDVDPEDIEYVEEELYTVKVDGEEMQVTSEELVKSYQLERAAQKRMQEAAELRKNSEAEMQAGDTARKVWASSRTY